MQSFSILPHQSPHSQSHSQFHRSLLLSSFQQAALKDAFRWGEIGEEVLINLEAMIGSDLEGRQLT